MNASNWKTLIETPNNSTFVKRTKEGYVFEATGTAVNFILNKARKLYAKNIVLVKNLHSDFYLIKVVK